MKIFQIVNDICHWHTPYKSIEETKGLYPHDVVFVEADDNVFEGWGYLDGQFIRPTPPDGWLYDDATGSFYLDGTQPPAPELVIVEPSVQDDILAMTIDHEYRLTLLELGVAV